MGSFIVKKMGASKTSRGNQGTFKTWGLIMLCLNTKVVKLYVVCGYSMVEFLLTYKQFTSDHGHPAFIHSDRGSQLVSAAQEVDKPDYDWDMIARASGGRSKWKWMFCPSSAQFQNGVTEVFFKEAK